MSQESTGADSHALFTSSPPHLLTSSPPHLLTSSSPHLLTSSPPHLLTPHSSYAIPRWGVWTLFNVDTWSRSPRPRGSSCIVRHACVRVLVPWAIGDLTHFSRSIDANISLGFFSDPLSSCHGTGGDHRSQPSELWGKRRQGSDEKRIDASGPGNPVRWQGWTDDGG